MVSVYRTQGSVLSVNVAEMREIERRGEMVRTGIWKRPVEGPVAVRGVNVEGDDQGDRSVHGGPDKAVYAYAREDIDWWERELGRELPDGVFGENLTLRGIDAGSALVGERWMVGSVLLEVSEPRFPCWKLGVRFGDPRMLKRFAVAAPYGDLPADRRGGLAAGRRRSRAGVSGRTTTCRSRRSPTPSSRTARSFARLLDFPRCPRSGGTGCSRRAA